MSNYVKISLLGPDFLLLDPEGDSKLNYKYMKEHWETQLDFVLPDKPDLIILPEVCDRPWEFPHEPKMEFYKVRGNDFFDMLKKKAKENHCYIAYAWERELPDGSWRNAVTLIGRDGNEIGVYDKNFITLEQMEYGVFKHGADAPVFELDFGRVGCAICFDLNFDELCNRYAAQKPDLIIFSSYYHGSIKANYWAYKCRAFLAGAIARNECYIISPDGKKIAATDHRLRFLTHTVNLDCCHVHAGRAEEGKLADLKARYGCGVRIEDSGCLDSFLVYSELDGVKAYDMVKAAGIETFDEHLAKALGSCKLQ